MYLVFGVAVHITFLADADSRPLLLQVKRVTLTFSEPQVEIPQLSPLAHEYSTSQQVVKRIVDVCGCAGDCEWMPSLSDSNLGLAINQGQGVRAV